MTDIGKYIELESTEVLERIFNTILNNDILYDKATYPINYTQKLQIYEELIKRKNELRTKKLNRILYEI